MLHTYAYVIVASVVGGTNVRVNPEFKNVTHICRFSEERGKSSVDAIRKAFEMKTAIRH